MITAVLFDFGGVITSSPFDGFAAYEREADLPQGLIRKINSTNPDNNAWAKFERSQITREEFLELFASEAFALGHEVDSERVLECLSTQIRPKMVQAVEKLSRTYKTAILTNNLIEASEEEINPGPSREHLGSVSSMVDLIIESSKIFCSLSLRINLILYTQYLPLGGAFLLILDVKNLNGIEYMIVISFTPTTSLNEDGFDLSFGNFRSRS